MALKLRRRLTSPQLTVTLTMLVAVLSLVTGIANIGATSVGGPFGDVVPPVLQRTAGFTGALTGFLMIGSALGMRRRLRVAWYLTILLLPLAAFQGLAQSSPLSLPLVVLSIVAIPSVLANRGRFSRELSFSTSQIAAGAALAGSLAYGTVGAYALREEFEGIRTPLDAFYFTLVTASTVGYGDVTPTSDVAKLFGMSVLVVGTASFALAAGAVIGPTLQARFSAALGKMTDSQLELLEDHVIVLGYGELTESILDELRGQTDVVIITKDAPLASELGEQGYNVLTADPSDEEPIHRAGIANARAVVAATNNDAEDALAVLTARQLAPDRRIVAAATDRENVQKLKRAGADTVISPATIGGHLLVQSALGREGMEEFANSLLDGSTGRPSPGPGE